MRLSTMISAKSGYFSEFTQNHLGSSAKKEGSLLESLPFYAIYRPLIVLYRLRLKGRTALSASLMSSSNT